MNNLSVNNEPAPVIPVRGTQRRNSIFLPLFLVAAGVVFLLSNIGVLTGFNWDMILRFWPVLLIVGALDGLWRGESIAGSIFWLGAGILFLLGNFGYLVISTWQIIFNFWPVLLIALGIDILIGRRAAAWAQILAIVLAIGLLAGIVWVSTSYVVAGTALNSQRVTQSLQGATSADVQLSMPAGQMSVTGGAPAGQLVEADVRSNAPQNVRKEYTVQNGQAVFRIREEGLPVSYGGRNNQYRWDFRLSDKTPTDLEVNLGAGEQLVNLAGLDLKTLKVNIGVGQSTVTLPEKGGFNGNMNVAVGELVVRVPRNLPITIHLASALTSVNVAPGFNQNGNTVTSPGSGGAPAELTLSSAIGELRVEYLP